MLSARQKNRRKPTWEEENFYLILPCKPHMEVINYGKENCRLHQIAASRR